MQLLKKKLFYLKFIEGKRLLQSTDESSYLQFPWILLNLKRCCLSVECTDDSKVLAEKRPTEAVHRRPIRMWVSSCVAQTPPNLIVEQENIAGWSAGNTQQPPPPPHSSQLQVPLSSSIEAWVSCLTNNSTSPTAAGLAKCYDVGVLTDGPNV